MGDPITIDSKPADAKKSLKQRIADFINDTVTLDVLTLTGTIELKPEKKTEKKPEGDKDTYEFNWDNIFKDIAARLSETKAEVELVAYTHAEWDQDSVNYVAKGADTKLVEAHAKTVGAAHEARVNALKAVAEAVEKLF